MYPSWLAKQAFDFQSRPNSWWEASSNQHVWPEPRLEGEQRAEVAIIGAGYTGLNAALGLAGRHSMDTIVLDASQPGWGASGRNGGFCSPGGAKLEYPQMVRRWGLQTTRQFSQVQQQAIEYVGGLGEIPGIEFERVGTGEYIVSSVPDAYRTAREAVQWMNRSLGLGATALSRVELRERGLFSPLSTGAIHMPHGFGLHPLKYAQGLARAVSDAGARIFCHSAVINWRQEGNEHVLETATGRVRAQRVLLATNGYTPRGVGDPMGSRILPVFSNILVTRELTRAELQSQGWLAQELVADDRALLHYFRLLPDGRFLFGGRGGIGGEHAEESAVRQRLEAEFRVLFPAWREVSFDYFWSGLVCLCRDLVFHVGQLPGRSNAWYGLAFHGGGVSMASWTGAALADMIAGSHDSRYRIPDPMLKPLPWMPLPALRPLYLRGAYAWYGLRERLLGKRLGTTDS